MIYVLHIGRMYPYLFWAITRLFDRSSEEIYLYKRVKRMNYTATYLNDLRQAYYACPGIEKLKGSKILITGATGLVCSAIVDYLLLLNEIKQMNLTVYVTARSLEKAVARFGDCLSRSDVVFVRYDATKEISWNFDVDYIIHGASPANPSLYASQPVETMWANINGLKNILDYALQKKTKRVLFVSSSEVYGKKNNALPYEDTEYGYVDILNPRACYPSAKRACETLCAAYQAEYEVDSVIARLGHIYGPTAMRTDTRASSQFFFDVLDGHALL